MASVFKKGRDKGRKGASWYFSYDDENGVRRTRKGFTEKRATENLAREVEVKVRRLKEGLVDKEQAKRKVAAKAPIEEHLVAFEKSISRNSEKHVKLTMSRLRRLVTDAEIKAIEDIDAESIEAVLGDMLDADEIGHKTYNHYVQVAQQFCSFLVPKRMLVNPLLEMDRLNTDVDIRHPRRALKPVEFQKLVASARKSSIYIQCYSGETRARIYTLSYMTGLRRKELASLTPSSFDLKATPPTVTVEAACSKHRKKDTLPLHPELVTMLKFWLKGLKRNEPLFPKLAKRRTWLMVKKDLERVEIPYKTDEGIADFHAAGRHTHITELLRNGATLVEARELARHSDVRMTMRYTHIGLEDQAKAVGKLPWSASTNDVDDQTNQNAWQRPGSGSLHTEGHSASSTDTETTLKAPDKQKENPGKNRGSGVSKQRLAPSVTNIAKVEAAGKWKTVRTTLEHLTVSPIISM